ncbi:MAG: hypothetical protein JWP74_3508 [Marmoricola sp.]|nr:hypothetical protein [Marmoricola sp.]
MILAPSYRRLTVLVAVTVALAALLAGCGGSSGGSTSGGGAAVAAALAKAKKNFDAASSVHLTMTTKATPTSGDAVLGADGTLTHQPAFEGNVKVHISGLTANVPIVSLNGKVHAKLPLTTSYTVINPGEYGAPDPADFADRSHGISGLLLKLTGATKTGQSRNGKTVVTTYAGTLTGALVKPIIPSANGTGTYKTVVGIDDQGVLTTLSVTGDFFASSGAVTYDLVFSDYNKNVTISTP